MEVAAVKKKLAVKGALYANDVTEAAEGLVKYYKERNLFFRDIHGSTLWQS